MSIRTSSNAKSKKWKKAKEILDIKYNEQNNKE